MWQSTILWCLFFGLFTASSAEDFGTVTFATSCSTQQNEFNTAVSVLHSFWYTKARELFQSILQKDPNCAIAYWGIAMTYWTPLWDMPSDSELAAGLDAVIKGRALAAAVNTTTEREREYIEAIATFFEYHDVFNYTTRVVMYEETMEKLYYKYQQEDVEAMVFYPLALLAKNQVIDSRDERNSVWPNYLSLRRSGKILETVQVYYPLHPGALHYTIHSYDVTPLAELGLHAADLYATAAPEVSHAVHMPSHIYNRLGMWVKSTASNFGAMAAAQKWNPVAGTTDGDYTHALSFGSYAMLQMAEDSCVKSFIEQAANWEMTGGIYGLTLFQCRYYVESENWAEASNLVLYPLSCDWQREYFTYIFPYLYTKGTALFYLDKLANLTAVCAEFDAAYEQFVSDTSGKWSNAVGQLNEIKVYKHTLLAFKTWLSGNVPGALQIISEAATMENEHTSIEVPLKVTSELAGQLYLKAQQPANAISWFNQAQNDRPNRFHTLFGFGQAYAELGNVEFALKYFKDFMNLCSEHTPGCECSTRPQFALAKNYIRNHSK